MSSISSRFAATMLGAAACLAPAFALPGNAAGTQLDDEGDFVHRPAHWNGVELDTAPKKLSELSTKAQHHHGAVQPFIAGSMESQSGYDTYRVYLLFDDDVGMSMYAAYGDEYSALSLSTDDGSSFFQVETPFGTDTGGVHPAMFDVKPEARYDSWLTFNQDDGENKDKINSIGIDWEEFNNGGKLETQDGAVFLMNPEEIPPFTGELPDEIADKTGRTILLAQLTVNSGTTFTGHVNVQGRRPDGGSWQEHGVCFSIGKGCTKHPRVHDEV